MSWIRRSPAVPGPRPGRSQGAAVVTALLALLALLLAAPDARAHEERPVTFPDGSGSVPTYRTGEPDLLVCKTDRAAFGRRISGFPAPLRARNQTLFERCAKSGYRHLQQAVDAVDRPGMNIAVLPGLYEEEPSLPEPTGACASLKAPSSSLGYQILSFAQQRQCPHNQNLVAILGKTDLQIEGTGASRLDVVFDAKYRKLNALRADESDGIYFRNLTAQRTTFNSLYILAGDGFVIDDVLTRWNDEYGFLTFASDHGLYKNCESYGNGDSGIYPGSASDINDGRGYDVPRHSIEIANCRSHHNMVGYSGTAGDSVWVHDSEFDHNMGGASMDSAFPGHPGLPQNHAKFERNLIHDNNQDYYRHVADGTC
ncbi:right-handed parallel beta-helix repeat-containing protein, partial [Streptomyces sp. NPDC097619]|uniref:right-handed parallel beta-helix repeat-containing protein n=1 Tax=Streptomyces sp. NPDC097619 TaxID=3157228 RepID=UPI003320F49C